MAARRDPVDRMVDLLVAAPTCTYRAARRAMPLLVELVRRGVNPGAPSDHRGLDAGADESGEVPLIDSEPAAAEPAGESGPDPDALAIGDYDHLAARQVVARLGGLAPGELGAIERYERAHRHRQTVLRRIEQLRS